MNMFSTKQKEDILTAVDTIIKVMPILETEDRDFCAALLYRLSKAVEFYGPMHGVRVPSRKIDFNKIRAEYGLGSLPDNSTIEINLPEDSIKDVIFNGPATIIIWNDGTKTVVKCQDEDCECMTREAGVAIAIMKKVFGNKGNFNKVLKRLVNKGLSN